ncbi:thioredoxin family protein [Pseudorhodoferax sp.]|uniref:thioredoxin family protein n=1 Tax=Pseudorhodoferax sp. TaxID=1993553 RepID=UPI002DD6AE03|nr:thioredoxin family protein [Pseudorhodoferax sp.]
MSAAAPLLRAAARDVYCLCAEWCGVCREWRARFDALAAAHPQDRFVWVDVDAQEAVLDILDIETFPVLLIVEGDAALFCGAVQPTVPVVERLLQGLEGPSAGVDPAARQLLDCLRTA